MTEYTVRSCPYCPNPPAPFTNTASVFGRYVCASGCTEELTAVSRPVVIQAIQVSAVQTVYPACARAGECVHYTITVYNRSSLPACQVCITDPALDSLLEAGTLYYNGQPVAGNLSSGVLIPGLGAGCSANLTFDARIPAWASGTISTAARARFTFPSSDCGETQACADAAPALLTVISPGLEIEKAADRGTVTPGQNAVTFTLTARNTGSCPLEDVVVTDELPQGLTYVPGSTRVNCGCPADLDPAAGICVGGLAAGGTATVTFRAAAAF